MNAKQNQLSEALFNGLLKSGIDEKEAADIVTTQMREIATSIGGRTFYIPKGVSMFSRLRNEKIRREYNGRNIRKLAQKYNVTERWIHNIISG